MPRKLPVLCVLTLILWSGCKVFYPDLMFQEREEVEKAEEPQVTEAPVYVIAPGDRLTMRLFSNKGFKLVDMFVDGQQGGIRAGQGQQTIQYLVQQNGYVQLPIIDSVKITGHTIQSAQKMLQQKYAEYVNDPFVLLQVTNRRVFVFVGRDHAGVVTIDNENTTLIEVLAESGGITANAKAYRIKIIRGDLNEPIIKHIDLSTIEGMKAANLMVQANDVIYVDPVIRVAPEIVREISPWVSLVSSGLIIYAIVSGQRFN